MASRPRLFAAVAILEFGCDGFEACGSQGQFSSSTLERWRDLLRRGIGPPPAAAEHEFLALPCAAEPLLSRRAAPPGNALEVVG
jgi:hypothetical protein